MKKIIKRPFRLLVDYPLVREFMLRTFDLHRATGVPAPFLEYALSSNWADITHTHHNAIWEEEGKVVAFCFYEARLGDAFFNFDPAYDFLAKDMIAHAQENLTDASGKVALHLFDAQTRLLEEAQKMGYRVTDSYEEKIFDLSKPMEYPLAEGFRYVEGNLDAGKTLLCCWKGFDHESEGSWDGDVDVGIRIALAPNATPDCAIAIEEIASGEYVCYGGMWWVQENKLAYLEPLCTAPKFRRKGLASALLSRMAHNMRAHGATYMTGGGNAFYTAIGYEVGFTNLTMKKE